MESKTVLVADDHGATRQVLRELLEIDGWSVVEARDGQEAVEKATASHPTAMVTDLGMPRLDGWSAAQALRRDPATADIYLIAVTGQELTTEQERGLHVLFDHVLVKPVRPSVLRTRLAQAVSTLPGERRTRDAATQKDRSSKRNAKHESRRPPPA
jgi:CheY-like chemotaxis protein